MEIDVMAVIGEDGWAGQEPGRESMARPDRRDGKLKARTPPLILFIRGQHRDCLLVWDARKASVHESGNGKLIRIRNGS
jgi:hypothetical protein